VYYWFVTGFGKVDRLYNPYFVGIDVGIIGSVVSLMVEVFFAYRVWILSDKKSRLLCIIICLVSHIILTRIRRPMAYVNNSPLPSVL
jgi:hypothetical protein